MQKMYFFTHVAERLQLPECTCFAALMGPLPNHTYRLQNPKMDTTRLALIQRELFDKFP